MRIRAIACAMASSNGSSNAWLAPSWTYRRWRGGQVSGSPLFPRPHTGRTWIEDFAAALLAVAQTDAQSASAFVETWPRMIEWALDAPGWAYRWETSFTLARGMHRVPFSGR